LLKCLLVASSKTIGGFDYFTNLPNGGLASIAGNIDKSNCEIKILDLVVVRYKAKKYFTKYIRNNHFDIIGFSCMVFQYHEMLELAGIVKGIDKNIITVLGGYYATVNHEELLSSDDMRFFDIIVRGEGEIAFGKLIDAVYLKKNYEDIPGISYIKEGKIINNPGGELSDLKDLKLPDRSARVFKNGFTMLNYPADVCETSRGCTQTCNFCSISKMYGKSYRQYEIERIIEDLKDAKRRGAKAIFFTDDNITLNAKHFEQLCSAIMGNGLDDIKYAVQASVQGFYNNPHLPALIKKAGFEWVFLGIESNTDEVLEFYKKNNQLKSSHVETVIKSLQKEGIFVIGGVIVGNPYDNRETIRRTYEFVKKAGIDLTIFFTLTPYPGTRLREELIAKNYVTNLHDYSKYDSYQTNIKTDYLTSFELFEEIDKVIQKSYIDTGAVKKIIKRYPLFFAKSFFKYLIHHPDMVFHHLTQGRFLAKKRKAKFGTPNSAAQINT
jgi:anaerobic magnesium-protoporphyrin IX monomethyl ester cyclase